MSLACGHTRQQHWADGRCGRCRAVKYDHLAYRIRVLPDQIDSTRRKLAALEAEAVRYGMTELVEVRP